MLSFGIIALAANIWLTKVDGFSPAPHSGLHQRYANPIPHASQQVRRRSSPVARATSGARAPLAMSSQGASPDPGGLPKELFASAAWPLVQDTLNDVPLFCVANEKGQPMEYHVSLSPDGDAPAVANMPFFYCDASAAQEELEKAKAETKHDGLDLVPFPLGTILEQASTGKCIIVPSRSALESAGAPPGTNPIGQSVPLFCCMEIMLPSPGDDKPLLPLFFAREEADDALQEATSMDGGDVDDFQIATLSLDRAVELLATTITSKEAPGFMFVPPASSINYIQAYLGAEDGSGMTPPPS